jgi:tetratricopeptide (TPR) repeat protein
LLSFTHLLLIALLVAPFQQRPPQTPPSAPKPAEAPAQDPLAQATSLYENAQKAHEAGDLAKAVDLYSEALKHDPTLWPAEFQRSIAYLSLNRLQEARSSIERVLKLLAEFSESPELRGMTGRAMIIRGEIALAGGDRSGAEESFRRALEINPQAGQAHAGLAEILLASDRVTEAITAAKAALNAGDDRSSTWTMLGTALVMTQQYDDAVVILNEALKRNARQGTALRSRAEAYIARQKFPEAINDLRAAAELEPDTIVRLRLAEVYARNKQHADAIALLQTILKAEPDNSEARTQLAAAMIDSGKAAEAITALEALVKEQPNRADLHAQLAELYLTTQPDKALDQYLAAAKLEPQQPRHQIGIATAMVRQRRFQEAVPILKAAIAANPPVEVAYFAHTNLATALFEMDDYAGAASEYVWILKRQQALGDRRRVAVSIYLLGICFDKLGDFEQALKAYENFLQLATSDNQLEIDKVKLRLPPLKRQIQQGQGNRKKN